VAWPQGQRRALWLVVPLAAPVLWLAHDWLLTGDALYGIRVPGRYTDLVSGPQGVPPRAGRAAGGPPRRPGAGRPGRCRGRLAGPAPGVGLGGRAGRDGDRGARPAGGAGMGGHL